MLAFYCEPCQHAETKVMERTASGFQEGRKQQRPARAGWCMCFLKMLLAPHYCR